MESLRDSVETSVSLGLFTSVQEASRAHVFDATLGKCSMKQCRDQLSNFNPARLSSEPYPSEDRPRGKADTASVAYHRAQIKKHGHTAPIWVGVKGGSYTLLDGAHRIVASYLEGKKSIPAYAVVVG